MFGGPKRFRFFPRPDANMEGLIPKAWGGPGAGPGAIVNGSHIGNTPERQRAYFNDFEK